MLVTRLHIKVLDGKAINDEDIKQALKEYLEVMEEWELDSIIESYINDYSYYDCYIAPMDTFNEYFRYENDILSIIDNLVNFDINEKYFYVTDLGYIKSCNCLWDYVCDEITVDSLIQYCYDNAYSLDLDEFEELKQYCEECEKNETN